MLVVHLLMTGVACAAGRHQEGETFFTALRRSFSSGSEESDLELQQVSRCMCYLTFTYQLLLQLMLGATMMFACHCCCYRQALVKTLQV